MWSFNPAIYLRHAWNDNKTVPGKIALVLFYLQIWILIISALWQVFAPSSQGMKCVLAGVEEGYSRDLARLYLQGMNLFMAFLLFYADRSGLHSWNVGMVTVPFIVVLIMGTWCFKASYPHNCRGVHEWKSVIGIAIAVFLLALAGRLFEERSKDTGTPEERQNLV